MRTTLLPYACFATAGLLLLLDASGTLLGVCSQGAAQYGAAFLLLAGSTYLASRASSNSRQGSLRPLALIPLIPLGTSISGLLGERVLLATGIVSSIAPLQPAANILLVAAIVIALAIVLADIAFPVAGSATSSRFPAVSSPTIDVLDGTIMASTLATLLWFRHSGVIPMLAGGEADELRFAMARDAAFSSYSRLIYVGSVALAIRLGLLAGRATVDGASLSKRRTVIVTLPLLVALMLFGSKYLYVFPVGVALLCYNRFTRRIRLTSPRVVISIVAAFLALMVITNVRGLGRAIGNSVVADAFVVLPEFRDMAATVAIADRIGMRVHSLDQLIWTAVPSEFLQIFGAVRKTASEQAFVYKNLLGYTFAGGSVRIGIMGELYMNLRLIGVAGGLAIMILLLARLDRYIARGAMRGFGAVLALALSLQILWMFQAELATNMGMTWYFTYYLAFVLIIEWLASNRALTRVPAEIPAGQA